MAKARIYQVTNTFSNENNVCVFGLGGAKKTLCFFLLTAAFRLSYVPAVDGPLCHLFCFKKINTKFRALIQSRLVDSNFFKLPRVLSRLLGVPILFFSAT